MSQFSWRGFPSSASLRSIPKIQRNLNIHNSMSSSSFSSSSSCPSLLSSSSPSFYGPPTPTLSSLTSLSNPLLPSPLPKNFSFRDTKCPYEHSHPLTFTILSTCGSARASTLTLPHGEVSTPIFMPVGTCGAMKGIIQSALHSPLNYSLMLNNTYHLGLRPSVDTVSHFGGSHRFTGWNHNILTDSGGFQMVSLSKLSVVSEDGVEFSSPLDGSKMFLSPEHSIHMQNIIGSDILMQLDDVISSTQTDQKRFEEATQRTIRWIDRCLAAHLRPKEQNLFPIVQGGLDAKLRTFCLEEFLRRDSWFSGYAIGGLAGGESKDHFWRVVKACCDVLPQSKPRYLMGVGYPLDLVICVSLGVDTFDCVWPARTARFGSAIVWSGMIQLRKPKYLNDYRPISDDCECDTCKHYTRAYLSTVAGKTHLASQLITHHNLHTMRILCQKMRENIMNKTFDTFVETFLIGMFGDKIIPSWVFEALKETKQFDTILKGFTHSRGKEEKGSEEEGEEVEVVGTSVGEQSEVQNVMNNLMDKVEKSSSSFSSSPSPSFYVSVSSHSHSRQKRPVSSSSSNDSNNNNEMMKDECNDQDGDVEEQHRKEKKKK